MNKEDQITCPTKIRYAFIQNSYSLLLFRTALSSIKTSFSASLTIKICQFSFRSKTKSHISGNVYFSELTWRISKHTFEHKNTLNAETKHLTMKYYAV